ncbi:MAG: hypothetical protein HYS38_04265 [Acidobacteria bacterium]|nr:hypothetical protein [Acidobacteriota bacterium]
MKTRLTPYYIELVYDACLKSFWRKKSLAKFLQQCGVSENFIATWSEEESKREFLDRLFAELPKTDIGRKGLLQISRHLIEQRTFPDLTNWEDSAQKIKAAQDAVSRLRLYHTQQDEEIQSEEKKEKAKAEFRRRQEEVTRSQKNLQNLNDRLNTLGKNLGSQQAGYDFQTWFYDLLDFSEISNRKPYIHSGRQIDGSLTLSGTTYLVELKFTAEQADVTDIDTFYKKIVTKADNTMGIMVSISGYSSVATKEASGEKTPMLLLDHRHLYLVLSGIMSFVETVERLRRHASQTGEAYLPAGEFSG